MFILETPSDVGLFCQAHVVISEPHLFPETELVSWSLGWAGHREEPLISGPPGEMLVFRSERGKCPVREDWGVN
jgi:hypothetical protein